MKICCKPTCTQINIEFYNEKKNQAHEELHMIVTALKKSMLEVGKKSLKESF